MHKFCYFCLLSNITVFVGISTTSAKKLIMKLIFCKTEMLDKKEKFRNLYKHVTYQLAQTDITSE